MKTHKKIRITKEILQDLGACAEGLERAMPLLPVTVSTDPDENVDLAVRIHSFENEEEGADAGMWLHAYNVPWLASTSGGRAFPGLYHADGTPDDTVNAVGDRVSGRNMNDVDVGLTAQRLAMASDYLLTVRGR